EILPAAYGSDLGAIWQAIPGLYIDVAVWGLYSEQEFVYVGDEGVVEPSGKSMRKGMDLGIRWQWSPRMYADVNLNYAHARSLDEEAGNDRIPLAPSLTSTGGITAQLGNGFSTSLRYRYIADRAANEDNSLTAEGYFINDLMLAYDQKSWGFQLSIENLFNQEWREAQFETESRLFEEAEPVSEIHFTPGTPFFLKAGVVYRF
ncbi:MAG: TonB-dependent receptor, partial [Bacteroidota bacterium]